ncbi:MAG: TatD family hydrolase [Flavobacteriaceae bacterium]|nr:TatD family hydrolase [Flavobacteriaceae bacterium]MDG2314022.1 TatD family hydrolase [Flavobacteriaceae bacterium]
MFIDSHTHLYVQEFADDRAEVIARAQAAGVSQFLLPAIDSETTEAMYQLKNDYPNNVHLMMGLHPTHVGAQLEKELAHVKAQLETDAFVAVGEIGIDLYWDKTTLVKQQEAFRVQIRWAKEKNLPIVIHCREAFDEIFEILEEEKGQDLRGVFHCFTGNFEQAQHAIKFGMKLGIGGVVTFKNGKIDQFLDQIDLKHIVLETDAPYLAPAPYRGKRNESAYLLQVAARVAEIYGKKIEEIAQITTQNSKSIFGI